MEWPDRYQSSKGQMARCAWLALVVLLGQLGVASEPATVLSLGFSAVVVTLGVLGGLLQLLQPSLLRYH